MKKTPELILWILVFAILLWPLGFAFSSVLQEFFWENVASSMIGTAAALIGGIPIALYIDRSIKNREEKKLTQENRVSEKGLLRLLKEELKSCQSMLEERIKSPELMHIQPFKTDLWHAASNSGKLSLIKNHSLLNDIATVYYQIDMVKNIESQGYISARSGTVTDSSGKSTTVKIFEDARRFDELLSTNFKSIFPTINSHI